MKACSVYVWTGQDRARQGKTGQDQDIKILSAKSSILKATPSSDVHMSCRLENRAIAQ